MFHIPTILKSRPAGGSFVLVIVLLLVLDRRDYEHDYEQEHEGSFACGHVPRGGNLDGQTRFQFR
ncbi:MAG: hypothetical protein HY736_16825 [Verrucomicrobia bacterium]|nr:hypothetical protein [Verrucomicrobiota bacterium]